MAKIVEETQAAIDRSKVGAVLIPDDGEGPSSAWTIPKVDGWLIVVPAVATGGRNPDADSSHSTVDVWSQHVVPREISDGAVYPGEAIPGERCIRNE